MINLKPSNTKLRGRMIGIVCEILGCDAARAQTLLEQNEWNIRRVLDTTN
jgi:N-acetylmuramic acid 6-phosphate (MurNAc-6-P) etherase